MTKKTLSQAFLNISDTHVLIMYSGKTINKYVEVIQNGNSVSAHNVPWWQWVLVKLGQMLLIDAYVLKFVELKSFHFCLFVL